MQLYKTNWITIMAAVVHTVLLNLRCKNSLYSLTTFSKKKKNSTPTAKLKGHLTPPPPPSHLKSPGINFKYWQ